MNVDELIKKTQAKYDDGSLNLLGSYVVLITILKSMEKSGSLIINENNTEMRIADVTAA